MIRGYPAYCKHNMVFKCAKLNSEDLTIQKVNVCTNVQWQSGNSIFLQSEGGLEWIRKNKNSLGPILKTNIQPKIFSQFHRIQNWFLILNFLSITSQQSAHFHFKFSRWLYWWVIFFYFKPVRFVPENTRKKGLHPNADNTAWAG